MTSGRKWLIREPWWTVSSRTWVQMCLGPLSKLVYWQTIVWWDIPSSLAKVKSNMVSDIASESASLIPNLTTEPPFSGTTFLSHLLSCEFNSGVATELWECVYLIRTWTTRNNGVKSMSLWNHSTKQELWKTYASKLSPVQQSSPPPCRKDLIS